MNIHLQKFSDIIKVAGFNYEPIDYNPIFQKLSPKKFFPQYYMNNKSSVRTLETNNTANNNKMSKFLHDFVLSPWIKKCGAEQRVPPLDACRIYWTPYSIGFATKSKKESEWFEARIYHRGIIAISGTSDDYGCDYELSEESEQYNILATDPYDN